MRLKGYVMAAAVAVGAGAAAEPAHAQFAYGAGATFPAVVYRSMMDCLYNQVQGSAGKPGPQAISSACPGFNSSGFGGMILYAPVGSGSGKSSLRNNVAAGTVSGSNTVPYTDTSIGVTGLGDYDGLQFAGSDDIITSADMAAWNTAGNPAKFGNLIQVPALVGPVGIGFNGKDGNGASLNIVNPIPSGGSSGLNLSRNAICGIFSGHITKWSNDILKALNGGTVLGTGNITVVHRGDGSGTTFLLSNALATQCQFEFGPNSETDSTTVSYAFPWTDNAASACPFPVAHGANALNWPDVIAANSGKDQCGTTITIPATGSTFVSATGSAGVSTAVKTTNGAIGYASPDYWAPVIASNPATANLQGQWDLTAGTGQFHPPTFQGAQTAMASSNPVFDSTTILNPLAWSVQGVVPNPTLPGSYPIAGFTWLEMYQCYKPHPNFVNSLTWFRTFMNYLYGSTDAHNIMNVNGFGELPFPWLSQVSSLLTDPVHGPNFVADSTGCTGKVGAL